MGEQRKVRYALVAGIDRYQSDGLKPLEYAERDAGEMARALRERCGFDTLVLTGASASRDALVRALTGGAFPGRPRMGAGDLFLFFFAGHGESVGGTYVIHPHDARPGTHGFSVSMADLRSYLHRDVPCREVVVVMDACRSAAVPGARGAVMDRESARDVGMVSRAGETGKLVEVLYGCSEGEQSWEDPALGHGALTWHLKHALEDAAPDEELSFEELANRAGDKMKAWRHSVHGDVRQEPHLYRPTTRSRVVLVSPSASWDLAPGSVVLGRWEVVGRLGRGGFGAVYEVEDRHLGKRRALKALDPELAGRAEMLARFRREVDVMQELSHPHVVRVFEYQEDPARKSALFTMELVRGTDAAGLMALARERGSPVPARLAGEVLRQALGALSHAHQRGVVHGDVTPGNVLLAGGSAPELLAGGGRDPEVKLSDFGLARLLARDELARRSQSVGTFGYLAPEAADPDAEVGAAADVYGAGAVAYALLAGKSPQAAFYEPVGKLRPDVGEALGGAVMAMVRMRPGERPDCASALAAVEEALEALDPRRKEAAEKAEREARAEAEIKARADKYSGVKQKLAAAVASGDEAGVRRTLDEAGALAPRGGPPDGDLARAAAWLDSRAREREAAAVNARVEECRAEWERLPEAGAYQLARRGEILEELGKTAPSAPQLAAWREELGRLREEAAKAEAAKASERNIRKALSAGDESEVRRLLAEAGGLAGAGAPPGKVLAEAAAWLDRRERERAAFEQKKAPATETAPRKSKKGVMALLLIVIAVGLALLVARWALFTPGRPSGGQETAAVGQTADAPRTQPPPDVDGLLDQANKAFDGGDYASAISLCDQILSASPGHSGAEALKKRSLQARDLVKPN